MTAIPAPGAGEARASDAIRILIADDHAVVRDGIRRVLEAAPDFAVVGEAADGEAAVTEAKRLRPDVVVLDISMPGVGGLEAARTLSRGEHPPAIVVLSMYDRPQYVLEAVRVGARAYVLKDASPEELRSAVRTVYGGGEHFPARATTGVLEAVRADEERRQQEARLERLTARERQVLIEISAGRTNREIGEHLGISHRTVETHRESLMQKLGVRTVAGLTRLVIETGLDAPDPPSGEPP